MNFFLLLLMVFFIHLPAQKQTSAGAGVPAVTVEELLSGRMAGPLPERQQRWLKLVARHATGQELEVFARLDSDSRRDAFIALFWKQRDPTPGTVENEFREELERRFAYCEEQFSRGTPRPGWMTDKGRIYMILGKPNNIENFPSSLTIYPAEVWYYFGDPAAGLPHYFSILFFRPYGTGDWRLYDPVADGIAALLIHAEDTGRLNQRALYEKLKEAEPTLAGPAISMIPGESHNRSEPSPGNQMVMARIMESPRRKVKDSWAVHFINLPGSVSAESFTRFMECRHLTAVRYDARLGLPLVHLLLEPRKISAGHESSSGRYYYSFKLSVSLKQGDTIIHQQAKNFEQYLKPEELEFLKQAGIAFADFFPAVPGSYQLLVMLQNEGSREFFFAEENIEVPAAEGPAALSAPLLAYGREGGLAGYYAPFATERGERLLVDPAGRVTPRDRPPVWLEVTGLDERTRETGFIEWELTAAAGEAPHRQTGRISLTEELYQPVFHHLLELPAGLPAGAYSFRAKLVSGENPLPARSISFRVTPQTTISRATVLFGQIPLTGAYHFHFLLGKQYGQLGRVAEAGRCLEKSVELNPAFGAGWEAVLQHWLRQGRFADVLGAVERLAGTAESAPAYHRLKGEALQGTGKLAEALAELRKANELQPGDVRLLNRLGELYEATGDRAGARAAYTASLTLLPNQPEIRTRLEALPGD